MKNTVPGHTYELPNFEDKDSQGQRLQFIHKEPMNPLDPKELTTLRDGTTNEDVLEVLIDRMQFL